MGWEDAESSLQEKCSQPMKWSVPVGRAVNRQLLEGSPKEDCHSFSSLEEEVWFQRSFFPVVPSEEKGMLTAFSGNYW